MPTFVFFFLLLREDIASCPVVEDLSPIRLLAQNPATIMMPKNIEGYFGLNLYFNSFSHKNTIRTFVNQSLILKQKNKMNKKI